MSRNTTRPQRPSTRIRPSAPIAPPPTDGKAHGAVRPSPAQQGRLQNTGIDAHRLIAAVALALLLVLSLIGPGTANAPNPASFLTPRIDGSGSVAQGLGTGEAQAIFPYIPFFERAQMNNLSTWPAVETIMKYEPDDELVRRAIIGLIYASSSGNLNITIAESGLEANPGEEKLGAIELAYQGLTDGEQAPRGVSGLAAMQLVRSLNSTGDTRRQQENLAITGFARAIDADNSNQWQLVYNWALANFVVGNYADAREGFSRVTSLAERDNNLLASFLTGLAALRNGDPGEAISILTPVAERQPEPGGNEAYRELFLRNSRLAREALGDAYWANRDPARAYEIYLDALRLGGANTTSTPYVKWLRLGLEQRAYGRLAGDLRSLIGSSAAMSDDPRVHHDLARLLTLLGQGDAALTEYNRAAALGDNDATLLISHGQALESRGDLTGALVKAQQAIQRLGLDPQTADLTSVARTAANPLPSLDDRVTAQQLLDANLLRARVFGRQGNRGGVTTLAQNITAQAGQVPDEQSTFLHLYAGFVYEAAGMNEEARASFSTAVERSRGTGPVAPASVPAARPGRSAAIAGVARTSAALNGPEAGLEALRQNGYDPIEIKQNVATDPDAAEILYQGSLLLDHAGKRREAANALRVSTILRNLRDATPLSGVGRPLWTANGTQGPANAVLQAADARREITANEQELQFTTLRYKQAFGLAPALAPAWNNLGVLYSQNGKPDRARLYLEGAGRVSPGYALGLHNLAALSYRDGFGSYLTAEEAQGDAIRASGARSLNWSYSLGYDERAQLPREVGAAPDLLSRLPAIAVLLLLFLHTLVPRDRVVGHSLAPGEGPVRKVGNSVDRSLSGGFFTAGRGSSAMVRTLLIPSLVGMLGLAWGAANGSWEVALVFLPAAFLASLVAFGANEAAQYIAARRAGRETLHNNWPTGVLLGLLSAPFGTTYGWQITTRLSPATARTGHRPAAGEAGVERGVYDEEMQPVVVPSGIRRLGLSEGSSILLAGLIANAVLALIFGLIYWLTGWPSIRLMLFASVLVLAFTSVSEAPADGWALHRRNPALWLAIFVTAATFAVLLAGGFI
jgi:tetratricopeptide (TPR) repeat protein